MGSATAVRAGEGGHGYDGALLAQGYFARWVKGQQPALSSPPHSPAWDFPGCPITARLALRRRGGQAKGNDARLGTRYSTSCTPASESLDDSACTYMSRRALLLGHAMGDNHP